MNLKRALISLTRILTLLFFSLLTYYIVAEVKNLNVSVAFVFVMIFLLCLILLSLAFLGRYIGCPNNVVYENDILLSKEISITEISPNVWKIDNSNTILDMNGWFRQKYYITNLICVIISIKQYNIARQRALSLPFGTQRVKYEKITLSFVNLKGRKKLKTIVKDYKIKKGLNLRFRFWCSLKSAPGSNTQYNDCKYYKMQVKDCFGFFTKKDING